MFKNFIKYVYKKFHSDMEYQYCRRCGKKLRTKESKKLGLGRCCYQKEVRTKYSKPLF